VATIDLVRVTINLMKSNYMSDNLGAYLRKLMRRVSTTELALMLQRMFEYEPVPREKFLQEILQFDQPLFCTPWFSTIVWVLQFEDSVRSVARKIWNKYGLVLQDVLRL